MAEVEDGASAAFGKAGTWLREAREAAGLSVADVAATLKLSPRQIEALEADDFANLPSGMFLRGFVRNYAKLLKLEPESLVALVDPLAKKPEAPRPPSEFKEVPFETGETNWSRFILVTLMVLAAVVAGAYWLEQHWNPGDIRIDTPAVSLQSSLPTGVVSEDIILSVAPTTQSLMPGVLLPVTVAAGRLETTLSTVSHYAESAKISEPSLMQEFGPRDAPSSLEFVFTADSWVEIRDKSGTRLVSQLMTAGSRPQVRGTPPFKLVVGNARTVKLTYRGKPVDLTQGLQGEVARITVE